MPTHRPERVADFLREELAQILRDEVRDPRLRDATVTTVRLSADLHHARVLVSMLGGEEDKREGLEGLRRATGFIRGRLARRITLRSVPELRFEVDHGAEHSLRISQLLDTLLPEEDEDEDEGEGP
ncbi:MAG TPA: 30S ribosome-binding factor RbfA [Thermoanaerobaculia bacterium]|nr:30S ribosome-binding factor RbfA [Thermoanaerobaculia bacterium]